MAVDLGAWRANVTISCKKEIVGQRRRRGDLTNFAEGASALSLQSGSRILTAQGELQLGAPRRAIGPRGRGAAEPLIGPVDRGLGIACGSVVRGGPAASRRGIHAQKLSSVRLAKPMRTASNGEVSVHSDCQK